MHFHEIIVNIYEDMSAGGRTALPDRAGTKNVDAALIGRDVAVTSHDNFVLDVEPLGEKEKDA